MDVKFVRNIIVKRTLKLSISCQKLINTINDSQIKISLDHPKAIIVAPLNHLVLPVLSILKIV